MNLPANANKRTCWPLMGWLLCALGLWATAEPVSLLGQEGAKGESRFDFSDTEKCLICHKNKATLEGHEDFCSVAPAEVWSSLDKHSQAFNLLRDPDKSRELTNKILGFDLREAFADDEMTKLSDETEMLVKAQTVKACIRCHATWPKDALHPLGDLNQPVVDLKLGVSCQGCHGPALDWNDPHSGKWWRRVTPEAKANVGMVDLRNPVVKAKTCTSCHVGDLAQERFVRHEWYAAGHPPLPSFELSTFASQMPAHWTPLNEKKDFAGRTPTSPAVPDGAAERLQLRQRRMVDIPDAAVKASYAEANFPDNAAALQGKGPFADLPRTKEMIISAAVGLQSYVKLVEAYSQAAGEEVPEATRARWPEFSLYDCGACHHELRRGEGLSQRPARRGVPGRPPAQLWPTALVQLAAGQLAGDDEAARQARWQPLAESLAKLESAVSQRPFGDRAAMAASAAELDQQLTKLCAELLSPQSAGFDGTAAKRVLLSLSDVRGMAGGDIRDYHNGRQIAWAIREVGPEYLRYRDGAVINDAQNEAFKKRFDDFFRSDGTSAGKDVLSLQLPSQRDSVVGNLPHSLKAIANYDADWLKQKLERLHTLIK